MTRILIAEDDPTSRLMLSAIIKKWGFEVVAVEDGQKAWEVLQQPDAPPIAILDWMMPEMDGLEVVRRVHALPTEQPPYIIMLTSKGEREDIIAGLEAGANDYVRKPFDNAELAARIRVGERMLELQDQIAQTRKVISMATMAAGVAHEINSPLQVVTGNLDSLLKNDIMRDSPEIYRKLEMAHRNSWRIAEITRALLSYIQAMPLRFALHNLNEIVTETIETGIQAPPACSLRAELAPDLPDCICDFPSLKQALIHLLKNAFEAMPGGGEAVVKTQYLPQEQQLVLSVSDTGIEGIAEENRERIFDPFFTTKAPGQGAGLGLSVVRGIVRTHGGEIALDSQPGKGTTFRLVLPLKKGGPGAG